MLITVGILLVAPLVIAAIVFVVGLSTPLKKLESSLEDVVQPLMIFVGDCARVYAASADRIALAVDEKSLRRYEQLSGAEDDYGLVGMEVDDELYWIEENVVVKVIRKEFGRREVRVMDGEHYGLSGWVVSSSLRKSSCPKN